MNTRLLFCLSIVVCVNACTLAPTTPRVDAQTLGKGKFDLSLWVTPSPAASLSYGLTDKLDIGIELEQFQTMTLLSKYNIMSSNGFSAAGTAGVFKVASDNRASGVFIGGIVNKAMDDTLTLFANYRFAKVNYTAIDTSDPLYTSEDIFGIAIDDTTDLSQTSQLNIGLSWKLKSETRLHVGLGCQHNHKNDDPEIEDTPCGTIFGLTF